LDFAAAASIDLQCLPQRMAVHCDHDTGAHPWSTPQERAANESGCEMSVCFRPRVLHLCMTRADGPMDVDAQRPPSRSAAAPGDGLGYVDGGGGDGGLDGGSSHEQGNDDTLAVSHGDGEAEAEGLGGNDGEDGEDGGDSGVGRAQLRDSFARRRAGAGAGSAQMIADDYNDANDDDHDGDIDGPGGGGGADGGGQSPGRSRKRRPRGPAAEAAAAPQPFPAPRTVRVFRFVARSGALELEASIVVYSEYPLRPPRVRCTALRPLQGPTPGPAEAALAAHAAKASSATLKALLAVPVGSDLPAAVAANWLLWLEGQANVTAVARIDPERVLDTLLHQVVALRLGLDDVTAQWQQQLAGGSGLVVQGRERVPSGRYYL
jgi:hypothetical protein